MLQGSSLVVVPAEAEAELKNVPVVIAAFCSRFNLVHDVTHDGALARFCFSCQLCITETLAELIAH